MVKIGSGKRQSNVTRWGTMRCLFLFLAFCLVNVHGQDSSKVPLLPARLGPMESLMWSEHGAMRTVFDFPLTVDGREREIRLRRNMLSLHQLGGFTTLAAMAATVALGQMVFNGERDLRQLHQAMAWTTVGLYFTTASLSIFTPPPMIRRGEWSSVSTHKLLATVHFTGMILTPYLGTLATRGDKELRAFHLASGYVTTAAFGAAILVVAF